MRCEASGRCRQGDQRTGDARPGPASSSRIDACPPRTAKTVSAGAGESTKVSDHGADWTILRPDWFAQNFSEGFWRQGVLDGIVPLPTGDGRTPFVDAEDIAEVAAAALAEDRHSGQTYHLTGPRAISFGEAAELIGKATGRSVRHVDVAPETYVERCTAYGVLPAVARMLTDLLVAIRDGSGAVVSDGVERALGRPARRFEDYVAETSAAGGWA